MAIGRYVVVDTPSKTILGGPYKWDPVTAPDWVPPQVGTLVTEAAAISGGYTFPASTPDPASVIRQKLQAGIAANNTFRALASPTNAQVVTWLQTVAAKELNGLMRLALGALDDTSDT